MKTASDLQNRRKCSLVVVILCFLCVMYTGNSQVYTDRLSEKEKSEQNDAEAYDYLLPIWGAKVKAMGYDLPYSAGIGVNYVTQESKIRIDNLLVGFNGGTQYNIDDFIRFDDATALANVVNIRPDIWLFPFLNVYGVFARADTSTEIEAVLTLPNETGFEDIASFGTKVDFEGVSAGIGITPTIGISGYWLALDANFTWTDLSTLDEPAFAFVFGPRIGKSFDLQKPEQNLAFWVGGFRVALNTDTSGDLAFDEIFEFDGAFQQKIDTGQEAVITKQNEVETWYANLSPPQQQLNAPKYQALLAILGQANDFLFRLEDASDSVQNTTVQYNIDKQQESKWNFIVGSQFQFNKHLMLRAEYGFLGDRTQFIGGLQYRFNL